MPLPIPDLDDRTFAQLAAETPDIKAQAQLRNDFRHMSKDRMAHESAILYVARPTEHTFCTVIRRETHAAESISR